MTVEMNKKNLKKVLFRLEKQDEEWPPAEIESVWVRTLSNGNFAVNNIPFFIRGVSFGDEIAAHVLDGEHWFSKLVKSNGHRTVRLAIYAEADVVEVRSKLEAMGCTSELSHLARLISVDVPPEVDGTQIGNWIRLMAEQDIFDFDEGNVDW